MESDPIDPALHCCVGQPYDIDFVGTRNFNDLGRQ
jgi:hypothetical protein